MSIKNFRKLLIIVSSVSILIISVLAFFGVAEWGDVIFAVILIIIAAVLEWVIVS